MAAPALTTQQTSELLNLDGIRMLKAERHLRHFVQQAWPVVEPSTTYQHNWHIDALADHLQATLSGDIRNLLITMPPRAMKSLTISVFFPAWVWIRRPELRFLYASYAQSLSTQHSMATRRVIESDWYQARWGRRFTLADDDNLKTRFSNSKRGERIATSVGAAVTGMGGDFAIADDPHLVTEAESDAVRESVLSWWNTSMSTRLNNPDTGVKIIVMQRVHERDLAGIALESSDYVHLNLPLEYETTTFVSPIGWSDPRTEPGELMWPERMTTQFAEQQKRVLGSRGYAAQYQQRPSPAEGGILKHNWFGVYAQPEPRYLGIVQAWDTAFKTGEQNDQSACVTLGVGLSHIDVLDVYTARIDYPDLQRAVEEQHLMQTARYPGTPISVLIEDKGSGQSLLQSLRRGHASLAAIPIPASRPNEKMQRVNEITPTVEAGRVRLPADAHWRDSFLHELTTFPFAKHDDSTDAFAIGVRRAVGLDSASAPVEDRSAFAGHGHTDPRRNRWRR